MLNCFYLQGECICFQSLAVPDPMLRQRRSSASSRRLSRPVTTHTSRRAAEGDASSDGSGTDYSDDEVLMLKKDDGFRPVKGQPGMYYKVCISISVEILFSLIN